MGSLKEEAENYKPNQTVADLEFVDVTWEIQEKQKESPEGERYSVKVVEHNHNDYRVPNSVLNQLKAVLETKPDLKRFKVASSGTGLATKYQVIPLE